MEGTGMPVAVSGRMKVLQERQKTLAAEGRKLAEIAADQRTDEQKARLAAITGDGGDLDRVVGEIEAEKKLIAAERAEILDVTDLAAANPWPCSRAASPRRSWHPDASASRSARTAMGSRPR